MNALVPLIARIFIALIFLVSGIGKIFNFEGTAGYMKSVGMSGPVEFFLVGAIIFLIAGSLSILLGIKPKIGAILLILFMIPTTFIFHFEPGTEEDIQLMKNLGLMGGLLMILAYGTGKWSIKE